MPTVSSIFCTRCGSSTPFAGLPDERRRVQSARCPPCTTAVRRGEDKWITRNGETRHCASCGIGFPARSKYARCQPCRTQDQTTLPALFTISSTPRVCDTCSNVLPQYEQSRRVCHRCRRRQVSQRSTANTPLPTPIETPLPMLIHAPSSPFRPIVPSPSSRPPATPMTPGRQTFPSPRTGILGTPVPPPTLRCCNSCGVRLPLSLRRYRFCGPCRAVNQRVRRRAGVPRGFQSSLEIPDALDIGDLVVECCKCHALFFKNEVQVTIDGIEKCCMRGSIFDELDPLSLPGTGRPVILPSSYKGGPRDRTNSFRNSIAIIQQYGTPSLFVTFTANPNWPEVQRNLYKYTNGDPSQRHGDRADLIARVLK